MTTATKIGNYIMMSGETLEWHYPLTVSEAYSLVIGIEKLTTAVYDELRKTKNSKAKEVLQDFEEQNQLELASLSKAFNYYLNCEIGEFYNSGGILDKSSEIEDKITNKKSLINRNLRNHYQKVSTIYDDIRNRNTDYFDTNNCKDIFELGLEVRHNSCELYERLAKLYPTGPMEKAFINIANLIKTGNENLENIH